MALNDLLEQLTTGNADERRAAAQQLIEVGGDAVPPLIALVLDDGASKGGPEPDWILRQIGRPAFWSLAEALATAPTAEARRKCGWAFGRFGADLVDLYAIALSHPSAIVRHDAATGVQFSRELGLPALPALLPLLADPDAEVRQRAVWVFGALGAGAVPQLQLVRDEGPGRLRAGALKALAEIGGEQAIGAADRAAIERLIRIKLLTETAEAIDGCGLCGSWLAVPTADQGAVLAALELSDPRPVTMRLGFAAFYCDSHGLAEAGHSQGRVFVTPQLDGWTLVMGAWHTRWGGGDDGETAGCRELSGLFGRAQSYYFHQQTGEGSWMVCADGDVVRAYSQHEPSGSIGPRLAVEEGLLLSFEELSYEEFQALGDDYELCDALKVAAAMSISLASLGPHTDIRGHGLLALTSHGREHGVPPGALPI